VSELQRVRRLPVFIDEEQWERAFKAAMAQVDALYTCGKIDIPHGRVNGTLRDIAVSIATAALRAAAQDDEGDISEVSGVQVAQMPNGTTKYRWQAGDGGVEPDEYFAG
jgi:hypothetical protein